MKSISPETFQRLQAIVAGNAGSQGEISLRNHDLVELCDVATGEVLSDLEQLGTSDRVVMISVPLLAKAVKQAAQFVSGENAPETDDEPAPKKTPRKR